MKNYLILSFFYITACVSIGPKKPAPVPAKHIQYSEPGTPFEQKDMDRVDKFWVNKKDGSTISYFSDCNPTADPTLQDLESEVLIGVEDLVKITSEPLKFNARKALKSHYSGAVDGVKTEFNLLVFKKNSCVYILSYVSLKENYQNSITQFNQFIKNFKVMREEP